MRRRTAEPIRDEQGLCIRCAPTDTGEAIGKLPEDPSNIGSRFEGYTSKEATETKILRNVFERGDAWFRTGDLMRKDEKGYFYFVDRAGDTFRWKGENVATSEVSEVICAFPGVKGANVYGVAIPGTDGRAGMAALVSDETFDLAAFRRHLINRLPHYARPLFLRIRSDMDMTATFKYTKNEFVRHGYDPAATADDIYFNDPEATPSCDSTRRSTTASRPAGSVYGPASAVQRPCSPLADIGPRMERVEVST
jgi:fatty-acyl-CoA synthase